MSPDLSYLETGECRFPGKVALVPDALARMRDYCLARGMRKNLWNELELATAEALNNAVEHGCAGKEDAAVLLRWHWAGDTFHVEVTDPGDFNPETGQAALPDDPLAEGGRGAFLMGQLMDEVVHEKTDGGHRVRMTKKVGEAAWKTGETAEMESTIESMAEDLSRCYEELAALFHFSEGLATASDFGEFLDHSLDRLLTLVPASIAYVRFLTPGKDALEIVQPTQLMPWIPRRMALNAAGTETFSFHHAQAMTVENCATLPEADPLHHFSGAVFVYPVFFQTKAIGCLVVTQRPGTNYFSAGELGLIRFVAEFLGIVFTTHSLQQQRETQQRAVRELEIAASIQQSLLPRTYPVVKGYRTKGVCVNAQQVGGDFIDAISLRNDSMLLVIADVMGKGVPAALLATIFRAAIRGRLHLAEDPGRLLTEVNHHIASDLARVEMFITAQVAYLSGQDHMLVLSNAGHCPLLHFRRKNGDVVREGEKGGIPLGILDDTEYRSQASWIGAGDLLVFLTDGVYEVQNPEGDMLGIDRLTEQIRQQWLNGNNRPADVLQFVRDFSNDQPASDDRTLLTVLREA
jgi:serine phosphatase RsbU (regulator of sigma subunit)/anti-sigma regulatory factor (Ser/Thr protein kinase)